MALFPRLASAALLLPLTACFSFQGVETFERTVVKTFVVPAHSTIRVDLQGGSIKTEASPARQARVELVVRLPVSTDLGVDAPLDAYGITLRQEGDELLVRARQPRGSATWDPRERVQVSARLMVPADVRLDAGTSGGSITVRGEREESLRASTSGGSIKVDGGAGALDVHTSGGSITLGRVLSLAKASTSGGRVHVEYVGHAATAVDLHTSGGSIHVGIDPAASLTVEAQTSGGSVRVDDLPIEVGERSRSHARGVLNGGLGRLSAGTSGGSIELSSVRRPEGPFVQVR